MRSWFGFSLLILYFAATWHSLQQAAKPAVPCKETTNATAARRCFAPLIRREDTLDVQLWLYRNKEDNDGDGVTSQVWVAVESCRFSFRLEEKPPTFWFLNNNNTRYKHTNCTVTIPIEARERPATKKNTLQARFVFRWKDQVVAISPLELTRLVERHSSSESTMIPHFKYSRAPIRLRLVHEDRLYGSLYRADGIRYKAWNATHYTPRIYVDELSLPRSAANEMAPPNQAADKPPIQLTIHLSWRYPVVDTLFYQVQQGMELIETMIPADDVILDEIRYFMSDERLGRFVLTQVLSYVHLWLEYLAFWDEIRFYRGRGNTAGVSSSTVVTRLMCSIILFLYLLDNSGGTSWVILVSMLSSIIVEAWKVYKLLQPAFKTSFPFVSFRELKAGSKEQEAANYDGIAIRWLSMLLYPLVGAWSLYALYAYEYKSTWSWWISNLANAVYMFGFISHCPQLYVNYRLKSVAHLPWKVFVYKIFTTFIDDVFAFVMEMPWKHRLMTLRDDVVFVMFLVQVYMYRVDKTRTNEFGYAYYENDESNNDEKKQKNCEQMQARDSQTSDSAKVQWSNKVKEE